MFHDAFDNALRALAVGRPRRNVLAALFGAALSAVASGETSGRRKDLGKREKHDRDRKPRKDKKHKRKKDKSSSGKGCNGHYSEQEILGFIKKAAKEYGQSFKAMERVARCESTLDPCAYSKAGPYFGLYQFLKSTWKTTPYGDKNIYDPKAQAYAAGWMWKQGRKNEWACQ
jgi:hypothetical protein